MRTLSRINRVIRSAVLTGLAMSATPASAYQRDRVTIRVATPPAALIVEDAQHRRSGIDLSEGVPENGFIENYLKEIPHSGVEAQNIANDEPVGPRMWPETDWSVSIMDGGDQTYTANLIGVQTGVASLGLSAGKPRQGMVKTFWTEIFVRKGMTRQIRVVFTPTEGFALRAERIVSHDQFGESLEIACALKLIASRGICRSLQSKARAASQAVKRGNVEAARGQLNALLAEIKAQSGKHVKEPAATILLEEATVLLKSMQ